jgi:hypothetical protein
LYFAFAFLEARIPPQTPPARGNPKRIPAEFKKISSRGFAKSFPQKDAFAKPSPHCIRISVLSLWESSTPRVEALQRTDVRLVICLEKSSRK